MGGDAPNEIGEGVETGDVVNTVQIFTSVARGAHVLVESLLHLGAEWECLYRKRK